MKIPTNFWPSFKWDIGNLTHQSPKQLLFCIFSFFQEPIVQYPLSEHYSLGNFFFPSIHKHHLPLLQLKKLISFTIELWNIRVKFTEPCYLIHNIFRTNHSNHFSVVYRTVNIWLKVPDTIGRCLLFCLAIILEHRSKSSSGYASEIVFDITLAMFVSLENLPSSIRR